MNFQGLRRKLLAGIGLCVLALGAAAGASPLTSGIYIISGSVDLDNGPYAATGLSGTLIWDGSKIIPDGFAGTLISMTGSPETWSGSDWVGYLFGDGTLEYASLSRPGSHELQLDFDTMRWGVSAPTELDTPLYGGPLAFEAVEGGGGSAVPEPSAAVLMAAGLAGLAWMRRQRKMKSLGR